MIGDVFVPIDGDLPLEQYQTRLKLADISFICTTKTMFEQLCQQSTNDFYEHLQFIQVDSILKPNLQGDLKKYVHEICTNLNPNNCAYMIFTSGTTGQPKPVSISHHSVMNTINDINIRIKLNKTDRILALNAGSTLVLLDQGDNSASDPFYWLNAIDKYQITIWNSVPQLLYLLYHAIDQNQIEQVNTIRSLRQILLSGDWIPTELPFKFYSLWKCAQNKDDIHSSLQILSLGDATECSIWSVFHWIDCTSSAYVEWQSISYGQSLYILSSTFDYCPDYVTGQLYIGGTGLAIEYYKNSQLTTRSFIIHPKTHERMYATGDSARFHLFGPDRVVELLDRIEDDCQVKVQGYRVECAEIECLLNKHEFIKQAVVVGTNNSSRANRGTFCSISLNMILI